MGEMENEYTAYNFNYSVIYLPNIIKIDGHLTKKFWYKQFVQFCWDTVSYLVRNSVIIIIYEKVS